MKKFFVLLVAIPLIMSCNYHSVHLLDDADLSWLEAYHNGDTVLFSSSEGVDTMLVSRVMNNRPNALGLNCFSDYHGNGIFENVMIHQGARFESCFLLNKGIKGSHEVTEVTIKFNYRFCTGYLYKMETSKREIDGLSYDDLIIVDNQNSTTIMTSPNNCEYFIWSKSQGLIQYKYLDGDTYTFYKKLPYQGKRNR